MSHAHAYRNQFNGDLQFAKHNKVFRWKGTTESIHIDRQREKNSQICKLYAHVSQKQQKNQDAIMQAKHFINAWHTYAYSYESAL